MIILPPTRRLANPATAETAVLRAARPYDQGRVPFLLHDDLIEMPPFTLCTRICAPPWFTRAFRRWPSEPRHGRPNSDWMPPLRFFASTAAAEFDGIDNWIGPFTELRLIGFDRLTRSKPASRRPLTVERSAWPSSFSA